MKFLVQDNLINPDHLLEVQLALDTLPHEYIKVLPFSSEIVSDSPLEGTDYIPYGSTRLTEICYKLGYKGCCFNENFNYKSFLENRDDMLNDNVLKIEDAISFLRNQKADSMWFTRPSNDLKEYCGMVETALRLGDWFEKALECDGSSQAQISAGMNVVLSEPRNIEMEWRYFIVGGEIVSGSLYKYEGRLYKVRELNLGTLTTAREFAGKWLPHQNCVMDLAQVDGEIKVIEFNCINSSGFYDNDVGAIFSTLYSNMNLGSVSQR